MITKSHISEALLAVGLKTADHLLVHSSLKSVGPLKDGAETLIDSLLEIVGTEGTLAMPSFNVVEFPLRCRNLIIDFNLGNVVKKIDANTIFGFWPRRNLDEAACQLFEV